MGQDLAGVEGKLLLAESDAFRVSVLWGGSSRLRLFLYHILGLERARRNDFCNQSGTGST